MATLKFQFTACYEVEVADEDYSDGDIPLEIEKGNAPMLLAEAIQDGHVDVRVEQLESLADTTKSLGDETHDNAAETPPGQGANEQFFRRNRELPVDEQESAHDAMKRLEWPGDYEGRERDIRTVLQALRQRRVPDELRALPDVLARCAQYADDAFNPERAVGFLRANKYVKRAIQRAEGSDGG